LHPVESHKYFALRWVGKFTGRTGIQTFSTVSTRQVFEVNTKVFRVEKFLSYELSPDVECVRIPINFYLDIWPNVLLSACCIFVCVACTYRGMIKVETRVLRYVPNLVIQKSAVITPELEATICQVIFKSCNQSSSFHSNRQTAFHSCTAAQKYSSANCTVVAWVGRGGTIAWSPR